MLRPFCAYFSGLVVFPLAVQVTLFFLIERLRFYCTEAWKESSGATSSNPVMLLNGVGHNADGMPRLHTKRIVHSSFKSSVVAKELQGWGFQENYKIS